MTAASPPTPRTPAHRPRARRELLFAALLFAALCALLALGQGAAPAQDAATELGSKMDELEQNVDQQGGLQEQIDAQNAAINDLIARESELRRTADAVQAELDQRQAALEQATAAVDAERAHLNQVRARLDEALGALETLLVDIYMSDSPDTLAVALDSASFDELVAQNEYLERIQEYDNAMVARVRGLREEVEAAVVALRETQDTIRESRNAIAERRRELDEAQAGIEAQHSELVALRAERASNLEALQAREKTLEDELGTSIPGPGESAALIDGEAVAPAGAPLVVKAVIDAANRIDEKPYIWGGGHGSFEDDGYDCSGAVSYALNGGGLIDSPLDSSGFMAWGSPGVGNWITIYTTPGHMYAVIAGLRFDTGGPGGGNGPRWSTTMRSPSGFVARHPDGF